MRILRKAALLAFVVYAVTCIAVIALAFHMANRHADGRSLDGPVDVVVVLGADVDPDDGSLSLHSTWRVLAGVQLLRSGKARRLLFTGGNPPAGPPSVAERMARMALDRGANPDQLIVEARARTTWENIRFTRELLDTPDTDRIAILTSASHLIRSALIADFLGFPTGLASTSAPTIDNPYARSREILREGLAWWYNLGKAGAWIVLGWAGLEEDERGQWVF